MTDQPRYTNLRDYLSVVRERRLMVAVITLTFVGVSLAVTLSEEPTYESETSLAFREASQDLSLVGLPEYARQTPEERAAVGAEMATRREVLESVRRKLKRRSLGAVSALPEVGTNLVVVRVRGRDPSDVAEEAEAVAEEIVATATQEQRQRYIDVLKTVRERLKRVGRGKSPVEVLRRSTLEDQLGRLQAARDTTQPVEIVRPATRNATPVSPRPIRNSVLALVVGLAVALIAAFVRDALDQRLKTSREIADEADLPLLGLVRDEAMGHVTIGDPKTGRGEGEVDLEAFRILRTNLEFLHVDAPPKRILVTSSLPEEGKSTVSSSLAVAAALSGKRALLVECDLRRPVLAERLGIERAPGLTDYLAGRAAPSDILRVVDLGGTSNGNSPATGAVLVCIPAGSPAPRPAELMASNRFADFVRQVGETYDIVVLDSSPLLPVVDTLELITHVDTVALCVRVGQTTRDQLRAARAALKRLPDRPTGLVVTGVKRGPEPYHGYYSYSYSAESG